MESKDPYTVHTSVDYDRAIEDYTSVIELVPDDDHAYNMRGNARQVLLFLLKAIFCMAPVTEHLGPLLSVCAYALALPFEPRLDGSRA